MKKLRLFAFLIISFASYAQEKEVKDAIGTFFKGLHASDTLQIRSACDNAIVLQTIKSSNLKAGVENQNMKNFLQSIALLPKTIKIEERLLSYDIKTDGPLAHAWTPYEFYINGKLSHTGVNSFTLIYTDGQWKIIHIIDTRTKSKN